MADIRRATRAEDWVTELGPDSGATQAPGITNGLVAAVWLADALPRLAECGTSAIFQFAVRQNAGSDLVLMTANRDPTPMWASYALLSQFYRGTMIASNSSEPAIAVHASVQPNGDVTVVLVNKGAAAVPVALHAAGPVGALGERWLLRADSPTATNSTLNGVPYDRAAVANGVAGVPVDARKTVLLPPYSVEVLVFPG
jgi:hypothetical protein